ncbi:MAG: YihY/virulence factor BrkB family protein [Nitriliruptoraceae bacterium]
MPFDLDRILKRLPSPLQQPVTIIAQTAKSAGDNRLPGLAAEIAFWVLLSLPALLLTIIAAIGLVGSRTADDWQDQLTERTVEAASLVLTGDAINTAVIPILDQLISGASVGVISIAFVSALWTTSRAVKVVLQTSSIVGAGNNLRSGWKDRLLGFGFTLGAIVSGAIFAPLLLAGPNFGEQLVSWIGNGELSVVVTLWSSLYWPVVVLAASAAISLLYHIGIPGRSRWRFDVPGAVLATGVWLAGSAGLRIYGVWFMGTDSIYGSLGGAIVGLLWLWMSGFAVLLGAQLNATLAVRRSGG